MRLTNALGSVFGTKAAKAKTISQNGPRKARFGSGFEALELRENPAAGLYANFAVVTPLMSGNLVSVNGPIAPGIGAQVDASGIVASVFGPGKDAYVNLSNQGLSLVVTEHGSNVGIEIGTFGVDGFDYAVATLIGTKPIDPKVNINDAVLLPFAPSNLVGLGDPNLPVNQPPGPYGNGAGP
jgi:hypothetical protein